MGLFLADEEVEEDDDPMLLEWKSSFDDDYKQLSEISR